MGLRAVGGGRRLVIAAAAALTGRRILLLQRHTSTQGWGVEGGVGGLMGEQIAAVLK